MHRRNSAHPLRTAWHEVLDASTYRVAEIVDGTLYTHRCPPPDGGCASPNAVRPFQVRVAMIDARGSGDFLRWIVGVALLSGAVAVPVCGAQRVAFVVGNATYEHVPALYTALNDAADVGAALGRGTETGPRSRLHEVPDQTGAVRLQ